MGPFLEDIKDGSTGNYQGKFPNVLGNAAMASAIPGGGGLKLPARAPTIRIPAKAGRIPHDPFAAVEILVRPDPVPGFAATSELAVAPPSRAGWIGTHQIPVGPSLGRPLETGVPNVWTLESIDWTHDLEVMGKPYYEYVPASSAEQGQFVNDVVMRIRDIWPRLASERLRSELS